MGFTRERRRLTLFRPSMFNFSRGAEMEHSPKHRYETLAEAARHLRLALDLLDSVSAPAQIGAHVDLAAHQLEEELFAPEERCSGTG
jgi:hypothetical protein